MARLVISLLLRTLCFAAVCLAEPPPETYDVKGGLPGTKRSSYPVARGSMVVNLSGFYNQTSQNGEDFSQTLINMGFLEFIAPNSSLGFRIMYAHQKQGTASSDEFICGPAVAYFYGKGKRDGYPYLLLSPQFASITSGLSLIGFGWTVEAGYTHFIAQNAAVTVAIGYTHLALRKKSAALDVTTMGVSLGLATFIY